MSVQRRAFGDVKNTINGTPAAARGVAKDVFSSTPLTALRPKVQEKEPLDRCTYLPAKDNYEDLREARESQQLYTLSEDDEMQKNQQEIYSEFTAPDFDEERFFADLLQQK